MEDCLDKNVRGYDRNNILLLRANSVLSSRQDTQRIGSQSLNSQFKPDTQTIKS